MLRNLVSWICLLGFPAFAAFPDVCVKCWYEVPNSNLSSVYQTPAPPPWGSAGYPSIMAARSGAAYDLKNNRLIIAGAGGGNEYAGNEVYSFDVDSLKWSRIKNATSEYDRHDTLYAYYLNGGSGPDSQQPRPGGTYDLIEYDSTTNSTYIFGVPYAYWFQTGYKNIHRLQMDSLTWSHPANISAKAGGGMSARDPATGKIWMFANGQGSFMSSFDPSSGTVTDHGNSNYYEELLQGQSAAIMPSTNRFITVGRGNAYYWTLVASGNTTRQSLATTGCDTLESKKGPGFEWSPVDRKMIAWVGGTKVITMDSTYTCSDVTANASNTVTPSAPQANGTYGRWRYIPKYNAFLVVNSTTGSVYFYRYSADPPVITQEPQGDTADIGQTATFEVAATGTLVLHYQWRKNGVNISGATSATFTTPILDSADQGNQYSVIITNVAGADTSAIATLTLNSATVVAITSPADGYLTNQSTLSIAWTVNGVTQTSQNSEALEVEGANPVIRCSGMTCDTITVTRDQTPPIVEITSPTGGAIFHDEDTPVAWKVDGVSQTTLLTENLSPGEYLIIRSAQDALGNIAHDTVSVTYSLDAPVIQIVSPGQAEELLVSPATVQWTVDGVTQTTQVTETLQEGVNTITRQSTYNGGTQSVSASVKIYLDSQPVECLDP